MKDWIKVVREYFPNASDDFLDYVLWNETAFPATTDEEYLRNQLVRLKQAIKLKRIICDCCGKMRWPSQIYNIKICKRCKKK